MTLLSLSEDSSSEMIGWFYPVDLGRHVTDCSNSPNTVILLLSKLLDM